MNAEIGAEAALFPEKEYINGIAVAVLVLCIRDKFGAILCCSQRAQTVVNIC
jgi:hypothetical protein